MIKFFRRIRKKLLEENRLSKYLVYAGGEIILVMIGILLALQVSNWNTDKVNQKRLKAYTQSLINDLKLDKDRLQECLYFDSTKVNIIDGLVDPLPNLIRDDSVKSVLTIKSMKVNKGTYETMSSNNDLQLYKSIDLQKSISKYYAEVDYVIRFENVYINTTYSNFVRFLSENRDYTFDDLEVYLNYMRSASDSEYKWYGQLITLNEKITKQLQKELER